MFDSVLDRGSAPKGRMGIGSGHLRHPPCGPVGAWRCGSPRVSRLPRGEGRRGHLQGRDGASASAPASPASSRGQAEDDPKKPKKPETIVQPKEIPQTKPPEKEPGRAARRGAHRRRGGGGVEGGVEGGVVGGVVGGVLGGVLGGQVGGTGTDVLPFGAGMTRPERLAGPIPQYTREALEAHVQGLMIVKCVITIEGKVEKCRIIKPLPHMEQAVLDALYATRYKPVTFQGRPVQVDYTFNIKLSLPR